MWVWPDSFPGFAEQAAAPPPPVHPHLLHGAVCGGGKASPVGSPPAVAADGGGGGSLTGADSYVNIAGGWLAREVPYGFDTMLENILDPGRPPSCMQLPYPTLPASQPLHGSAPCQAANSLCPAAARDTASKCAWSGTRVCRPCHVCSPWVAGAARGCSAFRCEGSGGASAGLQFVMQRHLLLTFDASAPGDGFGRWQWQWQAWAVAGVGSGQWAAQIKVASDFWHWPTCPALCEALRLCRVRSAGTGGSLLSWAPPAATSRWQSARCAWSPPAVSPSRSCQVRVHGEFEVKPSCECCPCHR